MRKKKAKLFYIVVSMALTMSFFLIGVYSAATRTATVSGSLSFNASYVWVKYNVQISAPYSTASPQSWNNSIQDGDFNETQTGQKIEVANDLMNISDASPNIAFMITFTKHSDFSKDYYIKVTGLPAASGPIASVTTNKEKYQSATGLSTAGFGNSIQLVIYFKAKTEHDFKSDQNFTFDIKVDLSLTQF